MPLASKSMLHHVLLRDVGLVERHHLVALADVEPALLVEGTHGRGRAEETGHLLAAGDAGLDLRQIALGQVYGRACETFAVQAVIIASHSDGGEAQRQTSWASRTSWPMSEAGDEIMAHDTELAHGAGTAQSGRAGSSWGRRLLGRFRRKRARRDAAHRLYAALVDQARQPVFYADWGVPDSRDGRLELVSLHAILLMRRLRDEGQAGQELAQSAVRPDVPGSRSPSARVGRGRPFGRQAGEEAGAELPRPGGGPRPAAGRGRPGGLEDVLRRNVYTEVAAPQPTAVGLLAGYVLGQERWLAAQDGAALLTGSVRLAPAAGA